MASKQRVVITGLGVATPIGLGIESFWDALIEGKIGLHPVGSFDASGFACQVAGELPEFKLADYVPKSYRKSAKVMSRDIMVAMICAYHAVADAGLRTKCLIDRGEAEPPFNLDSTRFGANIGAGLICADLHELASALSTAADEKGEFSLARWGAKGMTELTPLWLLKFLPNMLACHVTIVHDAQAPSNTITCQEASSHLAIGEAFRTIARGDADVCICGGAESKINPMAMMRMQLMERLNSDSNTSPERACQPFGADRAGTIPAEGGGLVILESLDHARKREARIYAELVGFGASSNAAIWSSADADGSGIRRALAAALQDAGSSTERIDLISPFGLGTREHDAAEMAGWQSLWGDRLGDVPAVTTRGAVGNNGAGSGAIDFAATVMALYHNRVPPSPSTDRLDDACQFRFVQGGPVDASIQGAIGVSSAMAGGQNAALVIRKFNDS